MLYLSYPFSVKIRDSVPKHWLSKVDKNMYEVQEPPDRLNSIAGTTDTARQVVKFFESLRVCPVCQATKSDFQKRERATFICHCTSDSCSAAWGLHVTADGERYPIIRHVGEDYSHVAPSEIPYVLGRDWINSSLH